MRIELNPLRKRYGEKRVIKKFLFFPKTLNGQLRWLEFAYIFQVIDHYYESSHYEWIDQHFVDEKEKDYYIYWH